MASRASTSLPYSVLPVGKAWDGSHGHYDLNRKPIDKVVIHSIVGTIQGATSVFTNDNEQTTKDTSAHYGVGLDGKVYQWVSESATAYHAGVYDMNLRSIGIEHEDNGRHMDPRPESLYQASAKLVADICVFYGIPIDREHIIKHSEVFPLYPTVKKATACPSTLDIDRIVKEAQTIASGKTPMSEAEIRGHLTQKATSLDGIGRYLGFPQEVIDSHGFDVLAIDKIKQFQTSKQIMEDLKKKMEKNTPLSPALSTQEGQVTSTNGSGDYLTSSQKPPNDPHGIIAGIQQSLSKLANVLLRK